MWFLTAQESLVPLELVQPAMMVAAAQNKQQRARFLRNAAAFCTMQVSAALQGLYVLSACTKYSMFGDMR